MIGIIGTNTISDKNGFVDVTIYKTKRQYEIEYIVRGMSADEEAYSFSHPLDKVEAERLYAKLQPNVSFCDAFLN